MCSSPTPTSRAKICPGGTAWQGAGTFPSLPGLISHQRPYLDHPEAPSPNPHRVRTVLQRPQLSHQPLVAAELPLGRSCLRALPEICKAEPARVIFISSAPALVSLRDLLLRSAANATANTERFMSPGMELNSVVDLERKQFN